MSWQHPTRPVYNAQQIHQIYDRFALPSRYRYEPGEFSKEVIRQLDGHGFLAALVRHMLAAVPFENLELHYSPHHQLSIHPDALFDKFIRQGKGRGGYCMENNVFLGTVLRSVGFDVMSVGARINQRFKSSGEINGEPAFGGWSHMVNLVTIRGKTMLVDVGYGAGGPCRPIPLEADVVELNMPPNDNLRLRHDTIPDNEYTGNKLWVLEHRPTGQTPWTALYCFEDVVCFLPQDFEVMNFYASTHRTSLFTYRVICSKAIVDEREEQIVGEVVLYEDKVYSRTRGERRELALLKTEKQRIEALETHFGVTLSQAQQEGIRGMMTALS